jgi:hypothetical protein
MTFNSGKLDDNPLRRFSWTKAAVAWSDEAGPIVREALKEKAPVGKGPRAGRLRDAIRYQRETSGVAGVTLYFLSNTPYTPYVLHGTRAHPIAARAARSLHWVGPQGDVFRRRVNHPGTKPNPFPERAVLPLEALLRERFRAAIEEAMKL